MSTLKVDNIRHNSATSDAITMASDGTCTAKITGMTGGGALSHRNIICNGDMRIAQRSVGPIAVSDGSNENYQTIDRMRFAFGNAAAGACNVSQSTDAPTTLGFTKSHKVDVTTVNTVASGQQIINLFYRIEGQDLRNSGWNHLSPSSFLTLSFYFKTTKTGTSKLPVMFRTRHGTNYYYIKNVTVTDPTNWNRYTVTIPGNSNLQIDDANTTGMDFFFTYYSGPDKDTSSEGSWGSTNAYSTSDSTNYFDSTSNDMFITGIQLEVGDTATSFEHRSYAEELLRCKRYYQRSTDSSRGTDYSLSTGTWHSADGSQSFSKHNSYYDWKQNFEVEMRAAPSLTIYGSSNQGDIHLESIAVGSKQVDWNNNTTEVKTKGFLLRHIEDQSSGNYTSGSGNAFGILAYTVDAEL